MRGAIGQQSEETERGARAAVVAPASGRVGAEGSRAWRGPVHRTKGKGKRPVGWAWATLAFTRHRSFCHLFSLPAQQHCKRAYRQGSQLATNNCDFQSPLSTQRKNMCNRPGRRRGRAICWVAAANARMDNQIMEAVLRCLDTLAYKAGTTHE